MTGGRNRQQWVQRLRLAQTRAGRCVQIAVRGSQVAHCDFGGGVFEPAFIAGTLRTCSMSECMRCDCGGSIGSTEREAADSNRPTHTRACGDHV